MRTLNTAVFNNSSITSGLTSGPINDKFIIAASLQATFTGTAPTGTLKFQCSNDQGPAAQAVNWSDIPSQSVAVSGSGSYLIPKFEVSYQWIRVAFLFTSGTGTVAANVKTIGG